MGDFLTSLLRSPRSAQSSPRAVAAERLMAAVAEVESAQRSGDELRLDYAERVLDERIAEARAARLREDGRCALIVQRSDRLARGDAKQARSLVEIVLWAIKHEVALHSVMDPEILAGGDFALVMGAIGAMKGHGESKVKSESVRKGMRCRADRGDG